MAHGPVPAAALVVWNGLVVWINGSVQTTRRCPDRHWYNSKPPGQTPGTDLAQCGYEPVRNQTRYGSGPGMELDPVWNWNRYGTGTGTEHSTYLVRAHGSQRGGQECSSSPHCKTNGRSHAAASGTEAAGGRGGRWRCGLPAWRCGRSGGTRTRCGSCAPCSGCCRRGHLRAAARGSDLVCLCSGAAALSGTRGMATDNPFEEAWTQTMD